jgi:hypothetical protein
MKKVLATLLVGMLAVFSFAAFEVTVGYTNTSLTASETSAASDVTLHGLSVGANYLYDGLGIEGGSLLVGGTFDYYFPKEFVKDTSGATETVSNMLVGINAGYRHSFDAFFVQGLFNYSFGLGDGKVLSSVLSFGGGVGTTFAVQNLDMNVGADVLFEMPTLSDNYKEIYSDELKLRPAFKVHAGVQF